ncbi:TetR/AcrR family transcriptional regulator [Leptospira semungkisensis]|uniref:TetR/AcrR family transcriptional regulator n=2 Tax=Leptospira semungkisensis TaxID=2484985 RepID=A0A4R9FZF4_9LEPT|nr:TetR/AcrR family transcriptional regulator [Leptospira semungkisensis]
MGYSKADKTESHDRIVHVAAARFRELGVNGIGVDGLMKEAGLTHGGFYRHFSSKEELISEAIEKALADGSQKVVEASGKSKDLRLDTLVNGYLSRLHCEDLANSCAVTTLAADVLRSNERARSAYTRQVEAYLNLLVGLIQGEEKASRKKAIAILSTLVGALSMARAVNDPKLSREILKSAIRELRSEKE